MTERQSKLRALGTRLMRIDSLIFSDFGIMALVNGGWRYDGTHTIDRKWLIVTFKREGPHCSMGSSMRIDISDV